VKVDMTIPFSTWLQFLLQTPLSSYIYIPIPIPIPFPIFWGRKIEFVIVVEAGQFLDHMRHHHRVRRVQKT